MSGIRLVSRVCFSDSSLDAESFLVAKKLLVIGYRELVRFQGCGGEASCCDLVNKPDKRCSLGSL